MIRHIQSTTMTTLRVCHCTHYRYSGPVSFGVHRLMIRPRDGHDMRVLDSSLLISPQAQIRWEFDTFGNSIAFASFADRSDELTIESRLLLSRYTIAEPFVELAGRVLPYPFEYEPDDEIDLAPLRRIHCEIDEPVLADWLRQAMSPPPDNSLAVLTSLAESINRKLEYRRREEEGVQTPAETLQTGSGTCRDFAFLFMEAARHLGYAARFVSGYLHDSATAQGGADTAILGAGATHAWAEVFLPGAGWVEFDPTNAIVAGKDLIRVATTRTPSQAMPIQGSFEANGHEYLGMEVTVTVTEAD